MTRENFSKSLKTTAIIFLCLISISLISAIINTPSDGWRVDASEVGNIVRWDGIICSIRNNLDESIFVPTSNSLEWNAFTASELTAAFVPATWVFSIIFGTTADITYQCGLSLDEVDDIIPVEDNTVTRSHGQSCGPSHYQCDNGLSCCSECDRCYWTCPNAICSEDTGCVDSCDSECTTSGQECADWNRDGCLECATPSDYLDSNCVEFFLDN